MSDDNKIRPRVIVCQRGARHRYLLPKIFESLGMLEALYTDSSSLSLLGRIAYKLTKNGIKNPRLEALVKRHPDFIPLNKIYSTDTLFIKGILSREPKNTLKNADILSPVYKKWGVRNANIIYTMNLTDIKFVEYAKEEGLKIIVDIFVSPLTEKLLAEEALKFPEANYSISEDHICQLEQRYLKIFDLADVLLCPSEWVASGCRKLNPNISHKIKISPYGSSVNSLFEQRVNRQRKKILFAGRDGLRKGLHYLAEASEHLLAEFPDAEILVAGIEKKDAIWMSGHENLTFLGHVPMNEMRDLFESASVFVLPSLSEGQAGVVIEALSMGCPVIITRECGVDIEDGKQGFIIPANNSKAIVDKVSIMLKNEELINQMRRKAIDFSNQFDIGSWSERLNSICYELIKKESL